jgi:hypothetical protein
VANKELIPSFNAVSKFVPEGETVLVSNDLPIPSFKGLEFSDAQLNAIRKTFSNLKIRSLSELNDRQKVLVRTLVLHAIDSLHKGQIQPFQG